MTFSDPDLRKLFNTFFVCAWKNLEGDPRAGRSPRVAPGLHGPMQWRGSGWANVQMVILTPDACLLHLVGGAINATDLKWEIAQALVTYEAMRAKPKQARRIVAWRQGRIQALWMGEPQRKPRTSRFQLRAPARPTKPAWGEPSRAERRLVERQREIVKRNALVPEHRLTTKMLTKGKTSNGFPNDGKPVGTTKEQRAPRRGAQPAADRPLPWSDMPPALRKRFAAAIGVAVPAEPAAGS